MQTRTINSQGLKKGRRDIEKRCVTYRSPDCHTSCRNFAGHMPCLFSAFRITTIPSSSSPICMTICTRKKKMKKKTLIHRAHRTRHHGEGGTGTHMSPLALTWGKKKKKMYNRKRKNWVRPSPTWNFFPRTPVWDTNVRRARQNGTCTRKRFFYNKKYYVPAVNAIF